MRAIFLLPILRQYNTVPVFDGEGNQTGTEDVYAGYFIHVPGLTDEQRGQVSINGPAEPIMGEPDYIATWIVAPLEIINLLTARSDCLFVIGLDDANQWVSMPIAPQDRVKVVNKLKFFGYEGSRFGLINATIQSSQNSTDAAMVILTRIFFIENPFVYYLHDPDAVIEEIP